ncbi:MAG: hypothetical protein JSV03_12835 [Planctomycetota bacterium]|nr:MAG: hypothetical protein JSV03_12835 [Planctomycetota bacterium]
MSKHRPKNKSVNRSKTSGGKQGIVPAGAIPLISALSLVVVIALAIVGLELLVDYIYAQSEGGDVIKIELVNAPDWVIREEWRPRILSTIELPSDQQLSDGELIRLIADQMSSSGWVSRLNRVSQDMKGTIHIDCDYRRPIAMVLVDGVYVPVDRAGYRLPEVYDFVAEDAGWIRIFGVQSDLPDIGALFVEDDSQAAVRLASLIFDCGSGISNRISGIDVSNFRGRRDKRENHIVLRARGGGVIEWGSAIGEEIEEPTAMEKIRNIAVYFEGRSVERHIDVSVYPNAWRIKPLDSAGRIVKGSRS